jgi:hypothetical protein
VFIGVGAPIWWWGWPGWWGYPYPYYAYGPYYTSYYPYPVDSGPVAQQYIQQSEPYFWYYCESAQAYYPYVQQCPTGWMKVVPTPTPPNGPKSN